LPNLEDYRQDANWLAKATDSVIGHWREKNARRRKTERTILAGNNFATSVDSDALDR
jgi:hypothetical protein